MDSMLDSDKNLKDTPEGSVKDINPISTPLIQPLMDYSIQYTKTNKLITALYMVTDTMESDEPIRLKLRTLGIEVLSDSASLSKGTLINNIDEKITVILSFLNITRDTGMISEMNSRILAKEFLELKQSIQEHTTGSNLWLEEFLLRPSETSNKEEPRLSADSSGRQVNSKGQISVILNKGHHVTVNKSSMRIGVQKGGTLLKALNKIGMSDKNSSEGFEMLKKKRRAEIVLIIKDRKSGATITDIRNNAKDVLVSCGEKTLQRELISMVSDNILYRTGSKRWSQYFLVSE